MVTNMSSFSEDKEPTVIRRYALATSVGDRILVHRGTRGYHKPKKFEGLYEEGDILTVKTFSDRRWEYGTEFHILEVEEFKSPENIAVLISPMEYVVIKNRFDLDPSSVVDTAVDDKYDFRRIFYCGISKVLWSDSSLTKNHGKVMPWMLRPIDFNLTGLDILGTPNTKQTQYFRSEFKLDGQPVIVEYKTNKSAVRLTYSDGEEKYIALNKSIADQQDLDLWVEAYCAGLVNSGTVFKD